MSSEQTYSKTGALRHRLAFVLPNPAVSLFAVVGFCIEAALLAGDVDVLRDPAFFFFLLLLLVWFWLTAGWVLWGGARTASRAARGWPSAVRGVLLLFAWLLGGAAAAVYLGSWALYRRTGQFATVEALRFALIDYRDMTWFYVKRSEPGSLLLFGVACLAAFIALPFFLRWISRNDFAVEPLRRRVAGRAIVWGGLALSCAALSLWIRADPSALRRHARAEGLRGHINPAFTLAASLLESLPSEKIEPSLALPSLKSLSERYMLPASAPDAERPSILFIKIESMRHDILGLQHQGHPIMPQLDALAADGLVFTRAYSQTTHTDYSDVSTLSSLFPLRTPGHHYYRRDDRWPKTLIYDLLKATGYATGIVAAENLAWGSMDKFLQTPGLDFLYDAERSDFSTRAFGQDAAIAQEILAGALKAGVLDDQQTMDQALRWIDRQVSDRKPFFLFLDLQSPHFPYTLPSEVPQPFQPSKIDFNVSFVGYPISKTEVMRNAYFNALHESDRQIGRLLAALRNAGRLKNCILVVFGDHGEAFHEHGLVTHAQLPIEPVIRVPLLFYAPGHVQPGHDDYPAELVDVPPTVLGLLQWPTHPNFQGIDLRSARRPPLEHRLLFIHIENPTTRIDGVIHAGRWKYCYDRATQREVLFDLTDDPGETRNLNAAEPERARALRSVLFRWRANQLAYYHYPFYYTSYYPPPAPLLERDQSDRSSLPRVSELAQAWASWIRPERARWRPVSGRP
jgi:arylsulfatase A-like enzyme